MARGARGADRARDADGAAEQRRERQDREGSESHRAFAFSSFLTSTTPRVAGATGVARGALIVAPPLDSISVAGPIRWPASVLHAATSMREQARQPPHSWA